MSIRHYDRGSPRSSKVRKILLATTSYAGPDHNYTFAMARTRKALEDRGILTSYLLLVGNCHVDDSRNSVVKNFLESDCTETIWFDDDVYWEPEDVVRLANHKVDIVGGVYPFRRENAKGMPCRMKEGTSIRPDGLLEVLGVPTGFLRIQRHVLESMTKDIPWYNTRDGKDPLLFQRTFDGESRWGGDINFCNEAVKAGYTVYADTKLRLGHSAKCVVMDSLGAYLRREAGVTLSYVADRLANKTEDLEHDFSELRDYAKDNFCGNSELLAICAMTARAVNGGAIIETGSGLTTVVMAAAAPNSAVYALEHDEFYAARTRSWLEKAKLTNAVVMHCPLVDGWYELPDTLPEEFALGLNDGPPRANATRGWFFPKLGNKCGVIIADDADEIDYRSKIEIWARDHKKLMKVSDRVAVITNSLSVVDQTGPKS